MQMLGPILLGTWGGKSLDESYETGNAWTITLSLLGVFSGLYLALRELIKMGNDKGEQSNK